MSSWRIGALLGVKTLLAFVLSAVVLLFFSLSGDLSTSYPSSSVSQHTDLDNPFSHLRAHCANSTPISAGTFLSRQYSLAQVLYREGIGAYVTEPGASATFFANVSARQWHTSERVFLVVVTPVVLGYSEDGEDEVEAQVSILAPKFEEDRARLLGVPSKRPIIYLAWAEEESPYEVLATALGDHVRSAAADESSRLFVSEGLKRAADGRLDVRMAPSSVRALRERKGDEELALMRCANEVGKHDKRGL